MESLQIDILNPKAAKLLKSMEEQRLIAIKSPDSNGFSKFVRKLRAMAKNNPLSMEEITKEVETLRTRRYANKWKD